jgi:chemotaxis protein MotB
MAMPMPKRERKKPNHERWVISYADLLTLLLAFFVVLYASSTRDKKKMAEEAQSFVQAFHGSPHPVVQAPAAGRGIMPHNVSPVAQPAPPAPSVPQPPHPTLPLPHPPGLSRALAQRVAAEVLALQKVEQRLETLLQPLTAKDQVTIKSEPLTLTIQLNASVLFPDGKAALTPPAVKLLAEVGDSLAKLPTPFTIVVQGYTDNKPIATAQFPSNWSLSAARAVSVVQLLQGKGVVGTQLAAEGFGEFAPIASNDDEAGRAKNRRVILVIHAPEPDGAAN